MPASGFFEWQKLPHEKLPLFIHLTDQPLFAFAGLYEVWKGRDGTELRTYTIITTEPNDLMAPIHNRMPVILPRQLEEQWLQPGTDIDQLKAMLVPFPPEQMEAYPVSKLVNNPSNNSPEIIEPLPL